MMDEYERGTTIMRKAVELSENNPVVLAHLGYTYAKNGEKEKAVKILEELNERSKVEEINSFSYVPLYIGLKNYDRALAILSRSYEEKNTLLLSLKIEPMFDELRGNDRFNEILAKTGI
jgi:tetratricopeptide (TPR) repeat protein